MKLNRTLTTVVGAGCTLAAALGLATPAHAATVTGSYARQIDATVHMWTNQYYLDGNWTAKGTVDQGQALPDKITGNAAYTGSVHSGGDAELTGTFRVVEANGTPTPYWVKMDFDDEEWQFDSVSCDVYDTDPNNPDQPGAKMTHSPFQCLAHNDGGDTDDHATLSVYFMTRDLVTVTDPVQQTQLLEKYCASNMNKCSYHPTSVVDGFQKPVQVGYAYDNNEDQSEPMDITWENTSSVTNSVGVKVSASFGFTKALKAQVAVSYELTLETSKTVSQRTTMNVPGHERGWFTLAEAAKVVTGDYFIDAGSAGYYFLPGAVMDFPDKSRDGDVQNNFAPIPKG